MMSISSSAHDLPFSSYFTRLTIANAQVWRKSHKTFHALMRDGLELLSKLSSEQITDAFRAAGYNSIQITEFTKVVSARIADLKNL